MKIKKDKVKEYIKLHENFPEEFLQYERAIGLRDNYVHIYQNIAIVFKFGNNVQKSLGKINENKTFAKWIEDNIFPLLEEYPDVVKGAKIDELKCVFNLNKQLAETVDK